MEVCFTHTCASYRTYLGYINLRFFRCVYVPRFVLITLWIKFPAPSVRITGSQSR